MIPAFQIGQLGRRCRTVSGVGPYLDDLAILPRCSLALSKTIRTASVAIRVRRSSDNAEQDIGFVGDALDTASLLSFVGGANNGFITKVYDQTGNGFHAIQTIAADQPRIVTTGTYLGSISFLSVTALLVISSGPTMGTPQAGVYGRIALASTASAKIIVESSLAYDSNGQAYVMFDNSGVNLGSCNAAGVGNRRINVFGGIGSTVRNVTALFDRSKTGTGEVALYFDGVAQTATPSATTEQTGNYTTYSTYIGGRGSGSLYATGMKLDALAFYNADTAAIQSSIEAILA